MFKQGRTWMDILVHRECGESQQGCRSAGPPGWVPHTLPSCLKVSFAIPFLGEPSSGPSASMAGIHLSPHLRCCMGHPPALPQMIHLVLPAALVTSQPCARAPGLQGHTTRPAGLTCCQTTSTCLARSCCPARQIASVPIAAAVPNSGSPKNPRPQTPHYGQSSSCV